MGVMVHEILIVAERESAWLEDEASSIIKQKSAEFLSIRFINDVLSNDGSPTTLTGSPVLGLLLCVRRFRQPLRAQGLTK